MRNARPHDQPVDKRSAPPRNPALAANVRRLMAGRSIATVREQMAQKGLAIGTGTLHRAYLGNVGNRLESLEKIADFFETTVDHLLQFDGVGDAYWPFSDELQQEVLLLRDEELVKAENVLRAHLGLSQRNTSDLTNRKEIATDEREGISYPAGTEEGAGPLDEAEISEAPKRNARQTNRGPARQKGSGGS